MLSVFFLSRFLLLLLQETHAVSDMELASWLSPFGYLLLASHHTRSSAGVAIFASHSSSVSVLQKWRDNEGRFACAELRFRGTRFRLSSVYAPNVYTQRNVFLEAILSSFDPLMANVIGGDFNSVPDNSQDRSGGNPSVRKNSSVELRRLALSSSTVDIWRSVNPNAQAFTWSNSASTISSRIDLFFCPVTWVCSV